MDMGTHVEEEVCEEECDQKDDHKLIKHIDHEDEDEQCEDLLEEESAEEEPGDGSFHGRGGKQT